MTVLVGIKISDGIVAASDSASTLFGADRTKVLNIYNNANKIFNLRKGLPIGAMSSGAGSTGKLSISTITKDFRSDIASGKDAAKWTVHQFADRLFEFVRKDHYDKNFKPGAPENPKMNLWVFGFSPGESFPEIFKFSLANAHVKPAEVIKKKEGGVVMGGETEVVQRVMLGYGTKLPEKLKELKVDKARIDQALTASQQSQNIVTEAMPIQDAIDLAEFLVRSTIDFSRFKMGAATVGGPIEIAAVTKHEGFKWIMRKHYFDPTLNPPVGD